MTKKTDSNETDEPLVFMSANSIARAVGSDSRRIQRRRPDGLLVTGHRRIPIFQINPDMLQQFEKLKLQIYGE